MSHNLWEVPSVVHRRSGNVYGSLRSRNIRTWWISAPVDTSIMAVSFLSLNERGEQTSDTWTAPSLSNSLRIVSMSPIESPSIKPSDTNSFSLSRTLITKSLYMYIVYKKRIMDSGHFAYETLRPLDSSPIHTSPTVTARIHIQLFIRLPYQY